MTRTGRAAALLAATASLALAAPAVTVHQAGSHPMRYHLSLPAGWSATRDWPVLVVIPDAGRQFAANLEAFVAARGERPYILVAPEVLTCGGTGSRVLDRYTYTKAVWDSLEGRDDFAFDDAGVGAVVADVRRHCHGERTAFLTGWEAGGHTVWALTFRHPERWRGVIPVTTNYQRRGLDPAAFSTAPERAKLPIQVLREGAPTGEIAGYMAGLDQQVARALERPRARLLARARPGDPRRGPRPAGARRDRVVRLGARSLAKPTRVRLRHTRGEARRATRPRAQDPARPSIAVQRWGNDLRARVPHTCNTCAPVGDPVRAARPLPVGPAGPEGRAMRTVAICILALMCGGCAAPAFDLVSHDPESPWLAGQRWVRTESSRATVSVSFDRYWLDHLGFEVEIVNQTDAPLVVDPRQFTFSLASSSDDLPRSLQQRFAAEDPARMRSRLEQATPGDGALNPLLLVAGVAVVALAVLAGSIDASPNQDSAYADASDTGGSSADGTSQDSAEEVDPQPVKWVPPSEFDRERDRSINELLQRVELQPGQSVRGEVWFAARPLRKLLGSAPSSGHGITAAPPRAPSDHALTLRTPDALGGQEIQYSVASQ